MKVKEVAKKLISWNECDEVDDEFHTFYDVQLKLNIGSFQKGDVLDFASIDLSNSELILCDDNSEEHNFDIKQYC